MRRSADEFMAVAATLVCVAAIAVLGTIAVGAIWSGRGNLFWDQWFTFVAVPTLLALAIASLFRGAVENRARAALAIVGLGCGLLTAEVLIVGLNFAREVVGAGVPAWDDNDSVFSTLLDLRGQGRDAFPTIPGNVLVDRDLGFDVGSRRLHPITPTVGGTTAVLCAEGGTPVTYAADRFGFNNPDSVWDASRIDVALVGDSYTQGVCVDEPHQPGNLLRQDRVVLNLGVRGAGPLQELAVLREYGTARMPGAVVWTYFEGNDLWDLSRESEREWLLAYLDREHSQGLEALHGDIDRELRPWLDSIITRQTFRQTQPEKLSLATQIAAVPALRNIRRLAGFGVLFPRRGSDLGLLPEILRQAKAEVESWGGRFIFVYVPAETRYRTVLGEGSRGRRELIGLVDSLGIRAVDLDSIFSAMPEPQRLWAVPGGHFNPRGYAIMASAWSSALDDTLEP